MRIMCHVTPRLALSKCYVPNALMDTTSCTMFTFRGPSSFTIHVERQTNLNHLVICGMSPLYMLIRDLRYVVKASPSDATTRPGTRKISHAFKDIRACSDHLAGSWPR